MTNPEILADLQSKFGEAAIINPEEHFGILNVEVEANNIVAVTDYLYKHPSFKFQFLTDLGGIHFPDAVGRELGVVYHLHSLENNVRLMLKVFVPVAAPNVPTLIPVFAAANWMEREAFDFYGIIFTGHPKLKRILNVDDMDYHPMRKEYPLEDATREDKIDGLFGR
jgi:NADH-quinone oxidoreductase subunit C